MWLSFCISELCILIVNSTVSDVHVACLLLQPCLLNSLVVSAISCVFRLLIVLFSCNACKL